MRRRKEIVHLCLIWCVPCRVVRSRDVHQPRDMSPPQFRLSRDVRSLIFSRPLECICAVRQKTVIVCAVCFFYQGMTGFLAE